MSGEFVIYSVLSCRRKNLKWWTDQCYSSVLFGKQRKIHSGGMRVGLPKRLKRREARGSILTPLCIWFFSCSWAFPMEIGLARRAFVLPQVLTPVLRPSFVLFLRAFLFFVFQLLPLWTLFSYFNYLTFIPWTPYCQIQT